MTITPKRNSKRTGQAPGTLVHRGEAREHTPRITIFDYTPTRLEEKIAKNTEDVFPFKKKKSVTWINVDGVHESSVISKLGKHFNLHPLLQEDVMDTLQRPKMEDMDNYVFVVLKMLDMKKDGTIRTEQVSLILGSNFLISLQETEGDVFEAVRGRIRSGKGRIRKMGSDYLAYALIDAIVDHYFSILEKLGEDIERIEEDLMTKPSPSILRKLHRLKRDMIFLRRAVWPLRDVVNELERHETKLIHKDTELYFRDVYDHTIQVIDTIETYRDILSSMLDIYLSSISNRMNEVMKVLTAIATIFIPLTFVTGWYGMNFTHMPELELWWAYPLLIVGMAAVGLLMAIYFKQKKWW